MHARQGTYVCNHTALEATSVGNQSTRRDATHTKVSRLAMSEQTPATMMTAWPSLWPVPPSAAVCSCWRVAGGMAETESSGMVRAVRAAWARKGAVLVCRGECQRSQAAMLGATVHKLQALWCGRVRERERRPSSSACVGWCWPGPKLRCACDRAHDAAPLLRSRLGARLLVSAAANERDLQRRARYRHAAQRS